MTNLQSFKMYRTDELRIVLKLCRQETMVHMVDNDIMVQMVDNDIMVQMVDNDNDTNNPVHTMILY